MSEDKEDGEVDIGPSVAEIKRRIAEPVEWVQATTDELFAAADLENQRHRRAPNRFALPLPDEVWLRYYRDHRDKPLALEHEHLRTEVDHFRQLPVE